MMTLNGYGLHGNSTSAATVEGTNQNYLEANLD